MQDNEIAELFKHHPPTQEAVKMHETIRAVMAATCRDIAQLLPPSRERSMFITKCQEAAMAANAAVAIHISGKQKKNT